MSTIINLRSYGGLHFGNGLPIKDFEGSYFEHPITKCIARINTIKYKPDDIYNISDGYAGNCWLAYVFDTRKINGKEEIIYNFRNFGDLIEEYKKEGFSFIDARY